MNINDNKPQKVENCMPLFMWLFSSTFLFCSLMMFYDLRFFPAIGFLTNAFCSCPLTDGIFEKLRDKTRLKNIKLISFGISIIFLVLMIQINNAIIPKQTEPTTAEVIATEETTTELTTIIEETTTPEITTVKVTTSPPVTTTKKVTTTEATTTSTIITTTASPETTIPATTTEKSITLDDVYDNINQGMKYDEVLNYVQSTGLEYSTSTFNRGLGIRVAYDSEVAPFRYAKEGDHLEIHFELPKGSYSNNKKDFVLSCVQTFLKTSNSRVKNFDVPSIETVAEKQVKSIVSYVYIASSGNGTKYHNNDQCSKMNGDCYQLTMEEAEAQGFEPCKKCYD